MATSPRSAVAIISAGLDNDYGHRHRSTLDILTHDKQQVLSRSRYRCLVEGARSHRTSIVLAR